MVTYTAELDEYIEYDEQSALVGDDYRPYVVYLGTENGIRGYRFPDRYQAREFVSGRVHNVWRREGNAC